MGKPAKEPEHLKFSAARLVAVQALYQNSQNKKPAQQLFEEYAMHRVNLEMEGDKIAQPDGTLLKKIIIGVEERLNDLNEMVAHHLNTSKDKENQGVEPLLHAILLCGIYELLSHQDIDFPIIINDYVDIAHSFYEGGESKLVNGVLDNAQKSLRD